MHAGPGSGGSGLMKDMGFDAFFEEGTGTPPYAYQRELGLADRPPSIVAVPTGSGKTHALLLAWMYSRLVLRRGPRRLVYALPMRTLVEQTRDVALAVRQRLGLSQELLPVHVLMGGEEATDWQDRPERNQVLIGTIDMLVSRALNRGYGESRFRWPVSFALLNSDCRWVFDEVQLMGPARATSAQLDGLREKLGTSLPCETVWVSATVDGRALRTIDRPQLGKVLGLPAADRDGPLAQRLTANKTVVHADLDGVKPAQLPRRIAEAVLEHHSHGSLSICVLNTVERAREAVRSLRRLVGGQEQAPAIVLLHSRFRPPDRSTHLDEALASVATDSAGRIVVSTQVIEAGVDVSARLLATETAPFSSIVQRAGRCNRAGEHDEATLLWLDGGEPGDKSAPPYDPADLRAARSALAELVGRSASPQELRAMSVPERQEDLTILRRRDLIDLFDTTPDLSGMDVDVGRFIREDDERTVAVFFRAFTDQTTPTDQRAPGRDELVSGPVGQVRERKAWRFDHIDGVWVDARQRPLVPGETVMLDATDGGYDERDGWDPKLTAAVTPVATEAATSLEGVSDDPGSARGRWVLLEEHLRDAAKTAETIVGQLHLPESHAAAVTRAAALHDVGKAHPVFQETLLSTLKSDQERQRRGLSMWAKSEVGGGRHSRRFFRHELASALALRTLADERLVPGELDHLIVYLVGAHHGRVRLSIRPMPDERPPGDLDRSPRYALGVAEGDVVPAVSTPLGTVPGTTLDLGCMEMGGGGRSWTDAACRLRDDPELGPFRLGYLEALVRIADWRASA